MLLARLHAYVFAPLHWHAGRMQSCLLIVVLLKCLLRITQHLRALFFFGIMHRVCCFSASVAIACGAVADSGSSIGVPLHPVVNIHLTDSNDAAVLNELADREINLEHLLELLRLEHKLPRTRWETKCRWSMRRNMNLSILDRHCPECL